MRRGVRIPAWYLLLVAVLGILSKCESLRDLERFAIRRHAVLTEALGVRGTVRKERTVIRIGRTRVHFDRVDNLGCFVELEVVLKPDERTG